MEMYVGEELPDTLEWYKDQIAGHHPSVVKNGVRQIGIVKEHGREQYLLKLVQEGKKGESEVNFYEAIFDLQDTPHSKKQREALYLLRKLVPQYFGRRTISIANRNYDFIELEDITHPFSKPCIMDVKLGCVTHDPDANEAKQKNEEQKCPSQKDLGFRILGYRLHADDEGNVRFRDRNWGRLLVRDNIKQALGEYFLAIPEAKRNQTIKFFTREMDLISKWFDQQQLIQIYASSLLFVYDGDKNSTVPPTVKMIDFSHVFYENQKDTNYIPGLNTINDMIAAFA